MAKKTRDEHKNQRKSKALKFIGILVFITSLIAGAFYFGWHLFTKKNSLAFTALTKMSDGGLLIYRYKDFLDFVRTDDETQVDDEELGDADWEHVNFGPKIRFADISGNRVSADDIYRNLDEKVVVDLVIGPDRNIAKVAQTPNGFMLQDEIEHIENNIVSISNSEYTLGENIDFFGSVGDVAQIYGYDDIVILAELVHKAGKLQVVCNVDDAKVFIDGIYKGKPPVNIDTAPGIKQIMIKSPEYNTAKTRATVQSGETTEVLLELSRVVGTIEITSDPSDAAILIDQKSMGTTPSSIELPPGEYEITLEKAGYYPKRIQVELLQDTVTPVRFRLAAETSNTPSMGDIFPSIPSSQPQPSGTRVSVVNYASDTRTLEGVDLNDNFVEFWVPPSAVLSSPSSGNISWDTLLPGEQVVVNIDALGDVERAQKVSSHEFSVSGKVLAKNGLRLTIGDNWSECTLSPNAIIRYSAGNMYEGQIDVGDRIAVFGASADNVKYVEIKEKLPKTFSVLGYLVRTDKELNIFTDESSLIFKVSGDVDVVDVQKRVKENLSSVPSGSKLKFYADNEANIVWAEYIWKAETSIDAKIANVSGPMLSLLPLWDEMNISLDTDVFLENRKRPFYDVQFGDTVLVAGPTSSDARFIWVKDRISYDDVVEGYIGSGYGSGTRVFNQFESSGHVSQWVMDTDLEFADLKQKRSIPFSLIPQGAKVKIWLTSRRDPVWGEIIDTNQIDMKGHYLGDHEGYWYFTGFKRFKFSKDIVFTGLFKDEELLEGSQVHISGTDQYIDYVDVQYLANPAKTRKGTVAHVDKNVMSIVQSQFFVEQYGLSKDVWFVDWNKKIDGSVQLLKIGDEVELKLDRDDRVIFAKRSYSPKFEAKGVVTRISKRSLTVTGEYGVLKAEIHSDAIVCKDGEVFGYWVIEEGDVVHLTGSNANNIDFVVISR